jgi:hypothetical protein
MTMTLDDFHIELLKKVRDRMAADIESDNTRRPYICWNVLLVHQGLECPPKQTLFKERLALEPNSEVRRLIFSIDGTLEGNDTFGNWLDWQVYSYISYSTLAQAYTLGRIAWLDRMIETRVVA